MYTNTQAHTYIDSHATPCTWQREASSTRESPHKRFKTSQGGFLIEQVGTSSQARDQSPLTTTVCMYLDVRTLLVVVCAHGRWRDILVSASCARHRNRHFLCRVLVDVLCRVLVDVHTCLDLCLRCGCVCCPFVMQNEQELSSRIVPGISKLQQAS